MVSGGYRIWQEAGNSKFSLRLRRMVRESKRRRGFPRRLDIGACAGNQRSSCNTLCCDWLASASADTAIDWRVDSAWLLACLLYTSDAADDLTRVDLGG